LSLPNCSPRAHTSFRWGSAPPTCFRPDPSHIFTFPPSSLRITPTSVQPYCVPLEPAFYPTERPLRLFNRPHPPLFLISLPPLQNLVKGFGGRFFLIPPLSIEMKLSHFCFFSIMVPNCQSLSSVSLLSSSPQAARSVFALLVSPSCLVLQKIIKGELAAPFSEAGRLHA